MSAQHTPGPLEVDLHSEMTNEPRFRVYSNATQGNVGLFYAEADAYMFAASPALIALAERVANLNEHAGEIGAGMLVQLVTEARQAVSAAKGQA